MGQVRVFLALATTALAGWGFCGAAAAQGQPSSLFASDEPLRIAIEGPVSDIVRNAATDVRARPATLAISGGAALPIRLSPRGLSRRTGDICRFPPLRVEFSGAVPSASPFAGQRRLKLVTHCNPSQNFQQHLLLEYAAYRLFNLVTPLSHRVRLASIDYSDPGGKNRISRWGFFIEDLDDVARRNGLSQARVGDRVHSAQLDPAQAGRVAVFQYMIGNLDWSMRAGPPGEGCCHNSRLLSAAGGRLVPVPYDFDYSGLVDAPYALPPDSIRVRSVRDRFYMGYCRHNGEAMAAAVRLRSERANVERTLAAIPDLRERERGKALAFLAKFFEHVESDETVRSKLLKDCVG